MNLGDLLMRWCEHSQGHITTYIDKNVRTVEPHSLGRQAQKVAAYMVSHGLRPGGRVVVLIGNVPEYVEVITAIWLAGLVAVPLDPRAGSQRLQQVILGTGACAIFLNSQNRADLGNYGSWFQSLLLRVDLGCANASCVNYSALVNFPERLGTRVSTSSSEPAMIVYTSGSTGAPKGVVISHNAAIAPIEPLLRSSIIRSYSEKKCSLICTPIEHEAAFGVAKVAFAGLGSLVLLDKYDPERFVQAIMSERCSDALVVPSILRDLLSYPNLEEISGVEGLEYIAVGGDALPPTLLSRAQLRMPNTVILPFYGTTECGRIFAHRTWQGRRPPADSVGVPVDKVSVRLGEEDGEIGELYVQTPAMMSGYQIQSQQGRVRTEGPWFKTADRFRRDENGFYYFLGRTDDVFMMGGESVDPWEIESILLGHPDVVAACVVPVANERLGYVPVAIIQLKSPMVTQEIRKDIFSFYVERGPKFTRPRDIQFVEQLPHTPFGKVDRRLIRTTFVGVTIV